MSDLVASSGGVADSNHLNTPPHPFQVCVRTYGGHKTREKREKALSIASVWFVHSGLTWRCNMAGCMEDDPLDMTDAF